MVSKTRQLEGRVARTRVSGFVAAALAAVAGSSTVRAAEQPRLDLRSSAAAGAVPVAQATMPDSSAPEEADAEAQARRVETGAPLRPPRSEGTEPSADSVAAEAEGSLSGSAPSDVVVDRPPRAATADDERCTPQASVEPRRRSPSITRSRILDVPCNPNALPEPENTPDQAAGLPDRWRIVSMLGYRRNLLDPYNGNNWLKGDEPAFGEDWFVNLLGISDTIAEPRRVPTPTGATGNADPGSNDAIGDGQSTLFVQQVSLEAVLYKGDTVFKPPDYEFRFTPVFNVSYLDASENGVVNQKATRGNTRTDTAVGLQALFIDKHLRNVSDRFDFDSFRVGIQPFISDFRGFLFQDSPIGVRLFGTRANNRIQYNIAAFRRIEKDANSGLNDIFSEGWAALRDDDVAVANLYVQDFPVLGFTSQVIALYNRNREGDETFIDKNSVIQRPTSLGLGRGSDYDVTYVGYNGDGHFGRWNLTTSLYGAFGKVDRGVFVDREEDIRAGFFAAELSRDYSWTRVRASVAYATGDDDPFDDRATGFDAVLENPQFAGADTSFYIHQSIPLIGGGRVALSGRNAFLNSLRTSKDAGQSNFVNPGLMLAGLGADIDLTPTLRVSSNVNYVAFANTAVLQVARGQGGIDKDIGIDASLALTWRPLAIQNIVMRLSVAGLVPGKGYKDLFGDEFAYSVLGNVVLTY